MARLYIPLLEEQNVRTGLFEEHQLQDVVRHLVADMRTGAACAHMTGRRTPSEVLPLEGRQVDLAHGEVRLESGTTKNGDRRVFPFTTARRGVLVNTGASG
ncbi:MAG TPA: hypothetical protein VFA43_12155 [Gemmatimonadaceae bacterium]|nr:hypothetical protein [Gemmatimonadaceae bacterium]